MASKDRMTFGAVPPPREKTAPPPVPTAAPALPRELLPDLRAAYIRRHWLGVQRFSFGVGYHSTLTTLPGWQCARWADDASGTQSLTVTPTHEGAFASTIEKLVHAMQCGPGEVVCDLSMALDSEVAARMLKNGWRPVGRMFSAHLLPAGPANHLALKSQPEGVVIREVLDAKTMADFTAVQEVAYRESYGAPPGATSNFYVAPQSLIGQDVAAYVLYIRAQDGTERPARSACLIRSEGLVSVANDAAIPEVRGHHLSECLLRALLLHAWLKFGVEECIYVTTPEARSIAARLGVPVIDRYRWFVPGQEPTA